MLVTLADGSVFGELSILNIQGNKTRNRRTANVRSVGYSDIFVLSKNDLWEVLEDYPDARDRLMERGTAILMKDNLIDVEALSRSKRQQETLIARSEKLTEGLQTLSENFTQLLIGFTETQAKLKQRITRLEGAISGLSPWQSSGSGLDRLSTSDSPWHRSDQVSVKSNNSSRSEQNQDPRLIPLIQGSVNVWVRPPSSPSDQQQ